jgi:hypothetical protein
MLVRMQMEDGQKQDTWLERELWFDLDIDGRWLVGVNEPETSDEEVMGAIVVRDPTVSAFIATLGKLIANPAQFAGEPVLIGPARQRQALDR